MINFALQWCFSLWNNVTFATNCCFPCKISNFVMNGNIPFAEWLTFPQTAIFSLPRLLCGIWLFSVCAHKYKRVCKYVCICGCVLCPCLAGCALVKMLLSGRYFISREKQACSCTKTSSPRENAHTHTQAHMLALCMWHSTRRLRRCHAPCLPAL